MYVAPLMREFPLQFCNGGSVKKNKGHAILEDGGRNFTLCALVQIPYQPMFDGWID